MVDNWRVRIDSVWLVFNKVSNEKNNLSWENDRTTLVRKIFLSGHLQNWAGHDRWPAVISSPAKVRSATEFHFNPITGGWCQFASPSIFSLIRSRRKYAHTQNFLTFIIYIYGIFLQNFMLLGDCVQNLWTFWDGALHEE